MRALVLIGLALIVLTLGVLEVVASQLVSERMGDHDVPSPVIQLAR